MVDVNSMFRITDVNVLRCPVCGSGNIMYDEGRGEHYCSECGYVISHDVYVGNFTEEDRGKKRIDVNVYGGVGIGKKTAHIDVRGFDSEYYRLKARRLRRLEVKSTLTNAVIRSVYFNVSRFAKYFNLKIKDVEMIMYDFGKLLLKDFETVRRFDKEVLALALIVRYLKKYRSEYPSKRQLMEIVDTKYVVFRVYDMVRYVEKKLDGRSNVLTIRDVWNSFVEKFGLTYEEKLLGDIIIDKIMKSGKFSGRSRMVVVGTVLYLVGKCFNRGWSQDYIAYECIGMTSVSLRATLKKIYRLFGVSGLDELCEKLRRLGKHYKVEGG